MSTSPTPTDRLDLLDRAGHDAMAGVAAYRPREQDLAREWSPDRRAAVLHRILDTPRQTGAGTGAPGRPGRGWRRPAGIAAVAAGVLVGASLLLPADLPGAPTSAAAVQLERLAVTAAASPERVIGAGEFLRLRTRDVQDGAWVARVSWTDDEGRVWRVDRGQDRPERPVWERRWTFGPGGSSVNNPSPEFLDTLPTEPDALAGYLRERVTGSTSVDEAVFVAVGDLLRTGFAPPQLRAAAIRVLRTVPRVSVEPGEDSLGRAAVVVTYVDQTARPGVTQVLLLDARTSALLEERTTAADLDFVSTVQDSDIVTDLPDRVRDEAVDPEKVGPKRAG